MKRYTIFRQLVIHYGSIFLFILASLFGVTYWGVSSYLEKNAIRELHGLLLAKKHTLENIIYQSRVNLDSWASLSVMDDILARDQDLRITRMLEIFKLQYKIPGHLYVLSTQGELLASDYQVSSKEDFHVWMDAIYRNHSFIGKHVDPVNKQQVLAVWRPVYASFDAGKLLGFMVMTYPWEEVERLLVSSGQAYFFFIYDENRKILYADSRLLDQNKLIDFITSEKEYGTEQQRSRHISLKGDKYLLTYLRQDSHRMQPDTWYWLALAKESYIFSPIDRLFTVFLLVALLVFLLAFLAIFLISLKISSPIKALTEVVTEIASSHDLSKRLHVDDNEEMSDLAMAFNNMCNKLEKSWKKNQKVTDELQHMNRVLEQKVAERTEYLAWKATHDDLTGLPNRSLLIERLTHAILLTQREKKKIAVIFIDLDGFKAVNDQFGHERGDFLLVEVAKKFVSVIRKPDTVARLGGDEFVILMHINQRSDLDAPLKRIAELINKPVVIDNDILKVAPSIGVTLYPDDPSDVEGLLRHADQAMYACKQKGGNSVAFYHAISN